MERSPHSSAYGQACTHCYKAKCRCVRARSGETCERCVRLKKRCEPSESVRKRNVHDNVHNAPTVSVSDSRIARLEDRVESLLSVMQSFISSTTGNNVNTANDSLVTPASTALGVNEEPTFATSSTTTVSPNPDPIYLPNQYQSMPSPSSNQTGEQLEFCWTRMLPLFLFLDLGPAITSGYLR